MTTLTTPILGVSITETPTSPVLTVGTRIITGDGKEYVYVQANGAIASAGQALFVDETFQAALLSTSNDALGDSVAVAVGAMADNDYGWVQVKGPCVLQVGADCAANALLMTTATAGQLDDTATGVSVTGVVLTAARGGTDGTAAAILNYPEIGATVA